jgi:hypothetical protein
LGALRLCCALWRETFLAIGATFPQWAQFLKKEARQKCKEDDYFITFLYFQRANAYQDNGRRRFFFRDGLY